MAYSRAMDINEAAFEALRGLSELIAEDASESAIHAYLLKSQAKGVSNEMCFAFRSLAHAIVSDARQESLQAEIDGHLDSADTASRFVGGVGL